MGDGAQVQRTPLYEEHLASGGRMVEFAGFELPVQYAALTEEHLAVRSAAGLFDVSHMGEVFIRGSQALDFVQLISCNDHSKMAVGRAQSTGLMHPEGTFVDDMLVHKMADDEYLLVVNAANRLKDVAYLEDLSAGRDGVEVVDASDDFAQLAVQGPRALEILQPLTPQNLSEIKYYRFVHGEVAGASAIVRRGVRGGMVSVAWSEQVVGAPPPDEELRRVLDSPPVVAWTARVSVPAVVSSERDMRGVTLVGVEPEDAGDTRLSLAAGERCKVPPPRTIADGLRVRTPGAWTWTVLKELLSRVELVSDAEMLDAMRFALRELLFSGGGRAFVLEAQKCPKPVVVMKSGKSKSKWIKL